jgi:hypothetical protein
MWFYTNVFANPYSVVVVISIDSDKMATLLAQVGTVVNPVEYGQFVVSACLLLHDYEEVGKKPIG